MRRPLTLLLATILPPTLIAAVPPGPVLAGQEATPSAVSSLGRERSWPSSPPSSGSARHNNAAHATVARHIRASRAALY